MDNTLRIILAVLLLGLSFFFSSAENAYSTVDKHRLARDIEEGKKNSQNVANFIHNYENTIGAVLFGNNLVNISLTALTTGFAVSVDNSQGGTGQYITLITILLVIVLLVFGEIIPKTIGLKFNYRLSYAYYYVFNFFYIIFTPFLFPFRLINRKVIVSRQKKEENGESYTEDELQVIVDEIEEQGIIDKETGELVRSAIEFTETEAYEVMTPRVDLVSYDIDDDITEVIKKQEIFNYSRIPVYEETIDNIIGILSTKDLIRLILAKKKINIRSLIKPPLFVHHSKSISEILTEFKENKNHIAVVIDEYGGTEGIVTLEDILEEVTGEIWDESDVVDEPIIKLDEEHYIIDGGVNIEDFFSLFDLEEDEENDYDTVAGWCLERLDRFAKVGDSFDYENIRVVITDIDGFVVNKIEVFVNPEKLTNNS